MFEQKKPEKDYLKIAQSMIKAGDYQQAVAMLGRAALSLQARQHEAYRRTVMDQLVVLASRYEDPDRRIEETLASMASKGDRYAESALIHGLPVYRGHYFFNNKKWDAALTAYYHAYSAGNERAFHYVTAMAEKMPDQVEHIIRQQTGLKPEVRDYILETAFSYYKALYLEQNGAPTFKVHEYIFKAMCQGYPPAIKKMDMMNNPGKHTQVLFDSKPEEPPSKPEPWRPLNLNPK